MKYKIVIPARANSRRLPGKNMKILGGKPLIEYSIDFALKNVNKDDVWVNSDDFKIIELAKEKGVNTLTRSSNLSTEYTSTVDVLRNQIDFFRNEHIYCDAIVLLQPTNPFRGDGLLKEAIKLIEASGRNSLATFSMSEKKMGKIHEGFFKPTNYIPGQRSQDIEKSYFENGLLYITKCQSILDGEVITDDVYPLICSDQESSVDIDYIEDFIFAESLLKLKRNEN